MKHLAFSMYVRVFVYGVARAVVLNREPGMHLGCHWMNTETFILTGDGSRFFGKILSMTGQFIAVGFPPCIIACLRQTAQRRPCGCRRIRQLTQRLDRMPVATGGGSALFSSQPTAEWSRPLRRRLRGDEECHCLATETPVI